MHVQAEAASKTIAAARAERAMHTEGDRAAEALARRGRGDVANGEGAAGCGPVSVIGGTSEASKGMIESQCDATKAVAATARSAQSAPIAMSFQGLWMRCAC